MVALNLVRAEEREFPRTPNADTITALRVWHCKYRSLSPVAEFRHLNTLVVATWPDRTLDALQDAHELQYLSLLHLPHVSDLTPLSRLQALTTVRLATLPSWDSSGRRTIVDSLSPLATLPNLRHLELLGVLPESRSLRELEESTSLRSVRVSKFPKAEVTRFRAATGMSDSFAPEPAVAWDLTDR